MREEERVTPLELFFDLVFVLAITQCTALMASTPTWEGVAKGLLVLGVVWWAWVGYAWLTSVVNPEEGAVRISIFVAMAAFLVVALSVPRAFEGSALVFAGAYAVVRMAQIALFALAGRGDRNLLHSVFTLGVSTTIGVSLLVAAAFADGYLQGALWATAIALDMAGPFFFGAEGWTLEPGHFAERHALIVIIAIGESIVAIGVGASGVVDAGVVAAAFAGTAVAAALWWLYFDVVALVAARRLAEVPAGRARNEMARDSYSYLHFAMVAGIVLIALGMKKTLDDVSESLKLVPAAAMLGGTALYLVGHVAFRLRNVRTLNKQRLLCAALLVAAIPAAVEIPALATATGLAVVMSALIAYEFVRFAEARERIRHGHVRREPDSPLT